MIDSRPSRAAMMAASLTMLDRSAPANPAVTRARASSDSGVAIGMPLECSLRMARRPVSAGRPTCTRRSKRPGRSRAVSSMSSRLVAAITTTRSRSPKPSSSTSSWLSVPSRSESAPPAAAAAGAADGVDLVEEDDRAGVALAGEGEQVADAGRADTHVGVHEVRAREREERDAGLAGDGLGEQRLAGSRRAVKDHAARHARADLEEAVRVGEEQHHLLELLDGLVAARDVVEAHRGRLDLGVLADLAVARHAAARAALGGARHAAHERDAAERQHRDDRDPEGQQQVAHQGAEARARGGRRGRLEHGDAVRPQRCARGRRPPEACWAWPPWWPRPRAARSPVPPSAGGSAPR